MGALRLFFWVFVTLTLMLQQTNAKLPGFKARITKKGIGYGNQVAHDMLAKELKTMKIPNQSGKDGHIEYSMTNIQNRGATVPGTSMVLSPASKGLTWSMSNLGLKLHADWRVKYKKGWVKASTSGSVDADIKAVSLTVSISLGADGKGRPTVSVANCNANVGGVSLKFHGGTAWILNIFKGTLGRKVRDMMKGQICQVVKQEINVDGAQALSKLKVTVPIAKKFLLDYGLVQAPEVLTSYLETEHKGEVYWKTDMSEAPFEPKAFPPLTNDTKMMYLWVSDYMANTLAFAAQKHNFLQYNLTADDFPPGNRSYFNTTCLIACIGRLIPQIGKKYPNSQVEARISSTRTPVAKLSKTSMTADTQFSVSLYAHTPDKQTPFLLTLSVNLSMSLQASIANEKLTGKIVDYKFDIGLVKSAIGNIHPSLLSLIMKGAMKLVIIPELNAIAKNGVDLPVTGDIKFLNTSIDLLDGSFVISTDVQSLISHSLQFRPEAQR